MDCRPFSARPAASAFVVIVAATCNGTIAVAHAQQSHQSPGTPETTTQRIRPTDQRMHALVSEGSRRSPVFQSLVNRLEQSHVFAYVGYGLLPTGLAGQLTLMGTSGRWRYVRIDIDCRLPADARIAALAHELQHALEVAAADALDRESMQRLFLRIGFLTDSGRRRYETRAAQATGARVRAELGEAAALTSR